MSTNVKKKTAKKKVTKASKKVAKKTTKAAPRKTTNVVSMTANQARQLQAALAKNNKSFKFLDTKISALA